MALGAPGSVSVQTLNATHECYRRDGWEEVWALYAGGTQFHADRFIRERRSEPPEVLEERRGRAFYLGYLGEIVDLFVANLFLKQLEIDTKGGEKDFWARFPKSVDRRGTDLSLYMLDRWVRALVQRCAYTWIDLPKNEAGERPETVADLDASGLRDAYLIPVNAEELLDFQRDDDGNLVWAIIHKARTERPNPFGLDRFKRHRWSLLHRNGIATYVADEKLESRNGVWVPTGSLAKDSAALESDVDNPCSGRVPLVGIELPTALCIGDKLDGVQRHLAELDNAISWQQFMALFAMPVVKSSKQFKQAVGEAYFIQLDPEDSFEWAEPAGTAMKASMDRREQLKDEMFRIAHQMAQSVQSNAETAARSGESKRRDRTPTEIVLDALGRMARDHAREVTSVVALARGEEKITEGIAVSGCDEFDVEDASGYLDNELRVNALGLRSEHLHRVREKRTVRKVYPDLAPEDLTKIDGQIDTAPEPTEDEGVEVEE